MKAPEGKKNNPILSLLLIACQKFLWKPTLLLQNILLYHHKYEKTLIYSLSNTEKDWINDNEQLKQGIVINTFSLPEK